MSGLSLATITGLAGASIDFELFVDYPIGLPDGTGPGMVTLADLNLDGSLDAIAAGYAASSSHFVDPDNLTYFLNTGAGIFEPAVVLVADREPQQVLVEDLNDDGWPDLLVANGGASNQINVFLNRRETAQGEWLGFPATERYPTGSNPFSITAGDFDGDGDIDAVTADRNSGSLTFLQNRGTSNGNWVGFHSTQIVPDDTLAFPYSINSADLNEDGKLDLAVANRDNGEVVLLFNTGSTLMPFPTSPFDTDFVVLTAADGVPGPNTGFVQVSDVDSDGHTDLIASNMGAIPGMVKVFFNDGTGDFLSETPFEVNASQGGLDDSVISTFTDDFDDDGDNDLLVCMQILASPNDAVRLYENSGLDNNGEWLGFEDEASLQIADQSQGEGFRCCGVATGDIDNDGKQDLLSSLSNDEKVSILLQD